MVSVLACFTFLHSKISFFSNSSLAHITRRFPTFPTVLLGELLLAVYEHKYTRFQSIRMQRNHHILHRSKIGSWYCRESSPKKRRLYLLTSPIRYGKVPLTGIRVFRIQSKIKADFSGQKKMIDTEDILPPFFLLEPDYRKSGFCLAL